MDVTRYNTRVIVLVHSHQSEAAIECSPDVISLQTSKSIKGSGGFNFTLVPRLNYDNMLFPNDVVNIYIDVGDGHGFVRVMMGYIDRIEMGFTTDQSGAVSTAYNVSGTDFVKAFDMTEIYFNPAFAARADQLGVFGQSQLGGGHALRTSGVVAYGTPAQFVENLSQLLLGFGSQWVLPASYQPQGDYVSTARQRRTQRAKGYLPDDVKKQLEIGFGTSVDDLTMSSDVAQQIVDKQTEVANQLGLSGPGLTGNATQTYTAQQVALSKLYSARFQLQAYQTAVSSSGSASYSILDLLAFDFIEMLAIDGFVSSTSVWTNQGALASFLYGWSNEIVNELCFDLRPVANSDSDFCFGASDYSHDPDELGVNMYGTDFCPPHRAAVQYAPAIVMREYPHSVVQGLNLSGFYVLNSDIGYIPFGPVFSQPISGDGRIIYDYASAGMTQPLSPVGCTLSSAGSAQKHLDVVKVKSSDMVSAKVARSDSDIFNLLELYAQSPNANMWKFLLADILPIITPVSIARHGLRVRSLTTKFANYARDQLCNGDSGVDTGTIRRNIIRWALMLDHWYQHNVEYWNGTLELRGMPHIRVGYRLDWEDRKESYYVEHVAHSYSYPNALRTTLQVSRGQRNDPYPAYIPPILSTTSSSMTPGARTANSADLAAQNPGQVSVATQAQATAAQENINATTSDAQQAGGGDRTSDESRLAQFFQAIDPPAVQRAVRRGGAPLAPSNADENEVDLEENVSGYAVFPSQQPSTQDAGNDINPTTSNYAGNSGSSEGSP